MTDIQKSTDEAGYRSRSILSRISEMAVSSQEAGAYVEFGSDAIRLVKPGIMNSLADNTFQAESRARYYMAFRADEDH